MKLIDSDQRDVFEEGIDLLIAICGYEARSPQLAIHCKNHAIKRKVAYAFEARQTLNWEKNREAFESCNFDIFQLDEQSGEILYKLVISEIDSALKTKSKIRMIVDYSCATRSWIAMILRAIVAFPQEQVTATFSYSLAQYTTPPTGEFFNEAVDPIPGFWSLSDPSKPVALILGLGYEPSRALGAREMLDPAKTFLFYTDPVDDSRFTKALQDSNEILLNQTPSSQQMGYDIRGISYLDRVLGDVCEGYSSEYSVVIVPLGPKPFCLAALVVSKRLCEVEVWRISGGGFEEAVDRIGTGEYVMANLLW